MWYLVSHFTKTSLTDLLYSAGLNSLMTMLKLLGTFYSTNTPGIMRLRKQERLKELTTPASNCLSMLGFTPLPETWAFRRSSRSRILKSIASTALPAVSWPTLDTFMTTQRPTTSLFASLCRTSGVCAVMCCVTRRKTISSSSVSTFRNSASMF